MTPAPVYLVAGDDATLRTEALHRLIPELLGDDDPTLALEEFALAGRPGDGEPAEGDSGEGRPPVLAAALSAASTPPFGTNRRVIVLREIGALSVADADAVVRWLADPLDTTVLVLVAGGGRVPAALTKAFKAAGGQEVRTAAAATGDALGSALSAAGLTLTPTASRRVTEWFGDDAGRVPGLVDLLRSSFGEGARLDVDDVEPYLGSSGSVAPYLLTGAIDRGETDVALDVLGRLRGSGFHPLQVMVVLHRHYQRILRLDDPEVAGENDAVAALGGKVKPYPAGLALRQSRSLGLDGIRSAYGALAKADLDLRGATAASEDATLEVLVARLAGISRRAGGGGRRPAGT
ncbi:MAG: DNA polymerase III subunit delta, partial [Acidimicrobiia bacterium]